MVESGSLKEYVVNSVVELINGMELDGETIQDILEQTGMDEQMYKQLNVKFNSEKQIKVMKKEEEKELEYVSIFHYYEQLNKDLASQ
jgi:preprotein translocase subunit Sec63